MTDMPQASGEPAATLGRWTRFKPGRWSKSLDADMIHLCRTNLDIRFQAISEESLQTENQRKIYATVRDLLAAAPATGPGQPHWDEIARIEGLMALLLNGGVLRQEISRRLHELEEESVADANSMRREYESLLKPAGHKGAAAPDEDVLRTFLLRVLETIHWRAKKKYLARPVRKKATKNTLWCLLVAFAFLVVPYVLLNIDFVSELPSPSPSIALASAGETTGISSSSDVEGSQSAVLVSSAIRRVADAPALSTPADVRTGVSKWWSLFALWTALSSGLLGAFFCRLISVQSQWTDMKLDDVLLHREWSYSLLRAGVGLGGALVVYFFLRSGIVEGALFPKFAEISIQFVPHPDNSVPMTFVMPSKDLALLTFWCFLAGFSERLVPAILTNSERQLAQAAATVK